MSEKNHFLTKGLGVFLILPGGALLYYLSNANYLLFHGLVEIITIVIAGCIGMIAWNTRMIVRRYFLLFIGLGYPFIALLTTLHVFAYKGLTVFEPEYGANLPTQLWIATRYLESLTFLVGTFFLTRSLKAVYVLAGFFLVTCLLLSTIFFWPIFPTCYIDGVGLTNFKMVSEFVICLVWLLTAFILLSKKDKFDGAFLKHVLLAISFNIIAELSFTLYVDVYGLFNFFGHLMRVGAVYFLYMAFVEKSLSDPYQSLFREVHMSDQYFRNLYDTAPVAFVVWDIDCRITQWNETAEKIFGWSKAEVKGKSFFDFLVPEQDQPKVEEVVEALREGTIANRSINRNYTKDGRTIICEWSNSILYDEKGNFNRVLSLGLDITEQKKAEKIMVEHSERIKRFAYSVVHDLKSPSAALGGLAKLLQQKYSDNLDDKGRLFCDQIMQVSNQMTDLIGNINSFVETREIPLTTVEVDLSLLFKELHEEFYARIKKKQLNWVTPPKPPVIRADETGLRRTLRNLIDNAIKYGGDRLSRIEIGFEENPTHYNFFVMDDGVGLTPGTEEKIFDLYARGSFSSGTYGTGLGLSITSELVKMMRGTIWAEPREGGGAKFCFYISRDL